MARAGDRKVGFFSLLFFAGLGASLGVLGWQGLTWLMTSVWKPISVLNALDWLHLRWAVSPTAWPGVHHFLSNTPLSAGLFAAAVVSLVVYAILNCPTLACGPIMCEGLRAESFETTVNPALKTPALVITVNFDEKKMEQVTFARNANDVVASRADEPGSAKVQAMSFDEVFKGIDAMK